MCVDRFVLLHEETIMERTPKYFVIEFKTPPTPDVDDYVIVPSPWVRIPFSNAKFPKELKALVKYPDSEKRAVTNRRVEEYENYLHEWDFYIAYVRYGCDDYKNAKAIIKSRSLQRSIRNIQTFKTQKVDDDPNKTSDIGVTTQKPLKVKLSLKSMALDCDASRKTNEETNMEIDEYRAEPIPQNNHNSDNNPDSTSTSTKTAPSIEKYDKIITVIKLLYKKVQSQGKQIKNLTIEKNKLRNECRRNYDILQRVVDSLNQNTRDSDYAETENETPKEQTEDEAEVTSNTRKMDKAEDTSEGTEEKESTSKKKLSVFYLPPEYAEKDLTWTLKHRKMAAGLVELMPDTKIYVNKRNLFTCITDSKDGKALAKMLMEEVFALGALTVCSLTGSRANAYNQDGVIRPVLNQHAKTVIIQFVDSHARERGWDVPGHIAIMQAIRSKLESMRIKNVLYKT